MKKYNYMTQNFAKFLIKMVPKWIQYHVSHKNETILYIYPEYLTSFLFFLRDHTNTQYKVLIDFTSIDYPSIALRFEVVYNLLSIEYNSRIRIKTCIDEITPLNSSTELYSAAGWWEREAWDMFGIFFSGHPDLRRILTDYGFEGHPLRKDFPVTGFTETRYNDFHKRIVYEKVNLAQEYRIFTLSNNYAIDVKLILYF